MSTPQRVVLGAWLAMIGLATVRSFSQGRGMPQPSVYLGSGVLFTLFFGAAAFLGPLPAALAVGVDVAAVASPYLLGRVTSNGPLDQAARQLDRISGGSGTQPASGPGGSSGNLTP